MPNTHRAHTATAHRWLRHRALALLTLAGCASSTTAPDGVTLRLTTVNQSAPADLLMLFVEGELVNSGARPFTSSGCTRPRVAIDSLGLGGWVPLESFQEEQLIACIREFTVEPGSTASFYTSLRRSPYAAYPTGVRLRVRVLTSENASGPSSEFTLPR